jgi:hypothetical protein
MIDSGASTAPAPLGDQANGDCQELQICQLSGHHQVATQEKPHGEKALDLRAFQPACEDYRAHNQASPATAHREAE